MQLNSDAEKIIIHNFFITSLYSVCNPYVFLTDFSLLDGTSRMLVVGRQGQLFL